MTKRHSQKHPFRITYVTLTFLVLLLFFAGCSRAEKIVNNETPAVPLPTSMPPGSHQIYINAGQHENFCTGVTRSQLIIFQHIPPKNFQLLSMDLKR